jgi:integrase
MGLYERKDSKYIWKKYDVDPVTKQAPRPPQSTKIFKDAPTKAQRDQNWRDAELQYAQDLIDIRENKDKPVARPTITFTDYASWYTTNVTAHLRSNKSESSSIRQLVKFFGPMLIDQVGANEVREWRTQILKTTKASTVNNRQSLLSRMLFRAIPKYLETNPLAARKPGTTRKQLENLDEEDFEGRAFTREEFTRFVATVQAHEHIQKVPRAEGLALAYCAIQTMIRRGSLVHLTWADDRGTHFALMNTKTSRGRSKSIQPKPITPMMRRCLDALPRHTPHNRIFPNFWRPSGYEQITRQWFEAVCELGDIPYTRAVNGVTFHGFRHTGATWYLKAGHSVKAVMQLGGWTNAQLFLNRYVHVSQEEIASMAASMFTEATH